MWPWMRTPADITDDITCATPETLQGVLLMGINPITLGCHNDACYWIRYTGNLENINWRNIFQHNLNLVGRAMLYICDIDNKWMDINGCWISTYICTYIFVRLILMLWHRETHIDPQRNRYIIVNPPGIELTTSRLRQLHQLPVIQHDRFTPLKWCKQKHNSNDMPEAALGNWQPVWNAQVSISIPVCVNFELRPGTGDILTYVHTYVHTYIHVLRTHVRFLGLKWNNPKNMSKTNRNKSRQIAIFSIYIGMYHILLSNSTKNLSKRPDCMFVS